MRTSKGQAAMEFLMTYGWAILAAIIVIGILGYYYFSKSTMTPNAGVVNPPFYLSVATATPAGVQLEIKNNGQDSLTIQSVNISGGSGTCVNGTNATNPLTVAAGATTIATIGCAPGAAGAVFKGNIAIYYTAEGTTLQQTSTGSMTKTIA